MSLKEKVYKLLKKQEEGGELSNSERIQLAKYLEEEKYAEYINAYYYSVWNEEPNSYFDSQRNLQDIITSINVNATGKEYILSTENSRNSKTGFIYRALKYAAILVVGIVLSSVYYNFLKKGVDNENNIHFSTIEVGYGSKSKIILPDGSNVWLNSGSKITYPERFSANNRSVSLKGEAFFDVVKDTKRPFFVNTDEVKIRVLGTKFNVKSYSEENTVETTLISGKVELKRKNLDDSDFVQLKPNQKAVFYKSENIIAINPSDERQIIKNKNEFVKKKPLVSTIEEAQRITSWKDGKLKFDAELFVELAPKMERWYNVDIVFKDEEPKVIRYSGSFENESIEQAMNALKLSYPIKYEINKNIVYVYNK